MTDELEIKISRNDKKYFEMHVGHEVTLDSLVTAMLHHLEDEYEIAAEWHSYGFADAVELLYKYGANGLYVTHVKPEFGFHYPCPLPYRSFQLDDGCWCLQVRHSCRIAEWAGAEPLDLPF